MKRVLKVQELGIFPNTQEDQTLKLRSLLEYVLQEQIEVILFEEGIYHFYPDFAREELLYISNHDEDTIKRIAFVLEGFKHFTIRGNNTHFQFHTDIIPFYITDSSDITIEGISMDYERPIYSEGIILEATPTSLTIAVDMQKYPYDIKHQRLYFSGENFRKELTHFLEMDIHTKAPAYRTEDVYVNKDSYNDSALYEEIQPGIIKMKMIDGCSFRTEHKVGNLLILRHHPRSHPAFYVKDSEAIHLKDINIHHASGMAFIAQHTKDITLDHFNVCINPNNPRIFTANADATHFVYCYGQITIQNCLFENQLDDPVNIHGIYTQVAKILSPTEIIVRLVQDQQRGVRVGKVGEKISFIHNRTMLDYAENTIKDITTLNEEYTYIELEKPCEIIEVNHVMENKMYVPNVLIKNCIMRNNRARGCLLTSAGEVVVEDNYIATPGAGILVEGDSTYWFESGAIENIIIRNNTFDNCSYVPAWGHAPIQVTPSPWEIGQTRYHKNLHIEGNVFNCFDERLLFARHIENITFINNTIKRTTTYPPIGHEAFVLEYVDNFIKE